MEANIHQSRILVQGFQHDCFNLFTEEVVRQFDGADLLVPLEGVYQVDQARVVQAARAEVKFLQLSGTSSVSHDHLCKEFEDRISKEVFIADESLQVCLWQDIAEHLEASWTNLVERDVELAQIWCVLETLSQQDHTLVSNDVAFDIE